jgi:hypothetical protein
MLSSEDSSAICVQRFDGSRNSAIHTTYRISLRSSSLREPRYPLLRVVLVKMQRLGRLHFYFSGLCLVLMVKRPTWQRQAQPEQQINAAQEAPKSKFERARQNGSRCWY